MSKLADRVDALGGVWFLPIGLVARADEEDLMDLGKAHLEDRESTKVIEAFQGLVADSAAIGGPTTPTRPQRSLQSHRKWEARTSNPYGCGAPRGPSSTAHNRPRAAPRGATSVRIR